MTDEPTRNDLKSVWTNQRKDNRTMSAQELQRKVERYQIRAKREQIGALAVALAIMAFSVAIFMTGGLRQFPGPMAMSLWILVVVGLGRIAHTFYKAHKMIWPRPTRTESPETLSSACLVFYRNGLERQRRGYETGSWDLAILVTIFLLVFLPLFLRGPLPALPVVLIAVLIVLAFLERWRVVRKIRRELDALNAFAKENKP
jgi:hypothetical protein